MKGYEYKIRYGVKKIIGGIITFIAFIRLSIDFQKIYFLIFFVVPIILLIIGIIDVKEGLKEKEVNRKKLISRSNIWRIWNAKRKVMKILENRGRQ